MFRRCRMTRRGGGPAGGDKDRERLYRERQRSMVYDKNGNLNFAGLVEVVWEEFRFPLKCIVCAGLFTYGYQKLVVYMCQKENDGVRELDKHSEDIARESGKLRSDRYLVKPRRQIDDPDMRDLPSHGGRGTFKSKLFTDDTYAAGKHHEEFSRSK